MQASTRHERRRRRETSAAQRLAIALAVVAAWQAVRLVRQVRRGWREQREADAVLRRAWTVIPAIGDSFPLRIHAREATDAIEGRIPPVVLVHGYGVAGAYFSRLAACLAPHAHVHVPDLPGHGRSDRPSRALGVVELADALGAWMDARGLDAAVLVGHSLGCQVIAELAVRRPSLAAGLVLIGPTVDPAARWTGALLTRAARTALYERPSLDARVVADYARAGVRRIVREMDHMLAHRLEDVLPRVRARSLVIRGEHDRVAPPRWTSAVAGMLGAPAPVVIRGWGHAVQESAPREVARHVLRFARSVAPPEVVQLSLVPDGVT